MTIAVRRIGYRVPRQDFDGVVHGVFARACYVDYGGSLLTVATAGIGDGPTTLVLVAGGPPDLRSVFGTGDALRRRGRRIEGRAVVLDLGRAATWRARKPRALLDGRDVAARVALARARLREARRTRSSVLDRDAGDAIAAIEDACGRLDVADALARLERLVGWGEGSTPAGDDYIVGLCAALGALVRGDPARRSFRASVRRFAASRAVRTTPISAHYLGLASRGHFNADILRALDALRAYRDAHAAGVALDDLVAVGATSGADALTGILSGFAAWTEVNEQ